MADDDDFVVIPPLADRLSPEEVATALNDMGAKARAVYDETTTELQDILRGHDAVAILARFGWRFFAAQATSSNDQRWPAAQQHHLELLQAHALVNPLPAAPKPGRVADVVERVVELLDKNAEAFRFRDTRATPPGTEQKARRRLQLLDQMRGITQAVRGEFHPHQLDRYLRLVLQRIDIAFADQHGVTATALFETLQQLLKLVEDRLNKYRSLGHRVIRCHKQSKAVKAYFSAFPQDAPRRAEILAEAERTVKPELMRLFLVEQAEAFLPDIYTLSPSDIASAVPAGANLAAVRRAIGAWSLAFGDLKERQLDHLYLANPVWDRPFIRFQDGRTFWPSPASSLSFAFEMFEWLMADHPALLKKYEDARAIVLEDELEALLKRAFPNARVLRGLHWTDPSDGKQYENDSVVLIDRTALLFEAKSGKVSGAAKRGADRRLQREIEKLMVDPAVQSKRWMDLLQGDRRKHTFQTATGTETIDSSGIDRIIRTNITFNIIGALSSHWPELVEAGIIDADAIQIPTMSLSDLDIVCEILKDQATIVHYLDRRSTFEANASYVADEYDLLAFYLRNGFNIGETEFDGTNLMIYGLSSDIDVHYRRSASEGGRRKLPKPKRTPLFDRLLTALEARRPDHWLALTGRLLNVGFEEQEVIERNIRPSIAKVTQSREPNMSWSAQLANGPPQRRQALAFVWYRCADREERNRRIRAHAMQTMEMAKTKDCLVVGFDVTRPAEPYSVIYIGQAPPPDEADASPTTN
jgi:hypothetical protein